MADGVADSVILPLTLRQNTLHWLLWRQKLEPQVGRTDTTEASGGGESDCGICPAEDRLELKAI